MKGPVLVVDDDADMLEALRDALGDAGYAVATAADGVEAMAYLESNPRPKLILLDWMMPRCNGAEFRRRQNAVPELRDVPVVLLSADAHIEDKTTEAEAQAYLRKPVGLKQLLEVVSKYVDE
jgi:two-component system, chemotaxis family, chemotaxis protein CheY